MTRELDEETKKVILTAQKNEITEHFIYQKLSRSIKNPHNKKVLNKISQDELRHYNFWKEYTAQKMNPGKLKMWKYYLISKIFGITFGIKLMERGEETAQDIYEKISASIPEAKKIQQDEDEHETQLIALLDEERLKYVSSIVLGLNDALVELLGALAGFTLTLQNTSIIAMVGFITGIAASLSMGASEYLSIKSEEGGQNPAKASVYTGSAYLVTVLFLIFPYLLFENYYVCLGIAVINAVLVILVFTFYVSVVKDFSFKKRFTEMAGISLGIAALTFAIGFLVRMFLHIDI
ncbi:MAG: VIT1/CCC1 transporter family protein [Theionarchaea archaeon]|nr:MAG: rubrerythrin family protein [Theionarchaea archaeon DG-70]MBU7011643.1 VIT1/CCC1 transporter family protein [Theionarchaea archaeon]